MFFPGHHRKHGGQLCAACSGAQRTGPLGPTDLKFGCYLKEKDQQLSHIIGASTSLPETFLIEINGAEKYQTPPPIHTQAHFNSSGHALHIYESCSHYWLLQLTTSVPLPITWTEDTWIVLDCTDGQQSSEERKGCHRHWTFQNMMQVLMQLHQCPSMYSKFWDKEIVGYW